MNTATTRVMRGMKAMFLIQSRKMAGGVCLESIPQMQYFVPLSKTSPTSPASPARDMRVVLSHPRRVAPQPRRNTTRHTGEKR